MKLSQIEYFIALAKHLNFTAAAKSLFITQPSLSKQLSLLEQELGVHLVQRNRKSVALTPAGELLCHEFERINADILESIGKVKALGKGDKVTIGCLEKINVDDILPRILDIFRQKNPDFDIIVQRDSFAKIREGLIKNFFDVIITMSFDVENIHNIETSVLQDRKGLIVLSKKHPLAGSSDFSVSDLENIPFFISSALDSPTAARLSRETAAKLNFRNIQETNKLETILSNVELGLGFTILDKSNFVKNAEHYFFYELPEEDNTFNLVCAWKRDSANPALSLLSDISASL